MGSISVFADLEEDASSPKTCRKLHFRVQDTGAGISDEEAQHLFEAFGKVNTTMNKAKNSKGTGLGLAIAKQLIDKMGGEIELESELGKGTTISFYVVESENSPKNMSQKMKIPSSNRLIFSESSKNLHSTK